ncbi:MAG: histidinol dehydrogenase [Acidobacteria bacterium]|nr:MAG: histidinol dehydrogenase [Acidobacteriota bacterium]
MRIIDGRDRRAVNRVAAGRHGPDRRIERRVSAIVGRVRSEGDRALIAFARRFDDLRGPLEVSTQEIQAGASAVAPDVRRAIRLAARNIARVASRQLPKPFELSTVPGVTVEQRIEPLARVGCYVPGGRFPLPSSLLMTAVPARVAGVKEILVVCPRPEPAVMAAALEAGVTRLFRIGGAHAVAALAYGTKTVPRVDKIVGPGNQYVAAAKTLVSADCAIDFHAGPTEIVIVAARSQPEWVAADLIAQAEHDPDARSVLITWNARYAADVVRRARRLAVGRDIVARSLARHGVAIVTRSADEAMALANRLAPEHLVVESEALVRRPITAGAVFVGPYSAQAAGDYATGSNHVLPTSGAARFRGGLSAADFVRVMSVQRLTREGLGRLAETILPLARAEGLAAHARSVEVRLS